MASRHRSRYTRSFQSGSGSRAGSRCCRRGCRSPCTGTPAPSSVGREVEVHLLPVPDSDVDGSATPGSSRPCLRNPRGSAMGGSHDRVQYRFAPLLGPLGGGQHPLVVLRHDLHEAAQADPVARSRAATSESGFPPVHLEPVEEEGSSSSSSGSRSTISWLTRVWKSPPRRARRRSPRTCRRRSCVRSVRGPRPAHPSCIRSRGRRRLPPRRPRPSCARRTARPPVRE
jgi:hypothetical protein